jgi:hypothetical protein
MPDAAPVLAASCEIFRCSPAGGQVVITEETIMRKYIVLLCGSAAMALTVAVVSASGPNRPLPGASKQATMSIEDLQRQTDAASLPITQINEPY